MRSLRQAVSIGSATPPPSCCGERGSDGEQLGRPLVELRCRTVFEGDKPTPGDLESDGADLLNAWHVGYVFSADAIIVEANEGALGVAGWGFVEAAEQALGRGNFAASDRAR